MSGVLDLVWQPAVYISGAAITGLAVSAALVIQARSQLRDYHKKLSAWDAKPSPRFSSAPEPPFGPWSVLGATLGVSFAALVWPMVWAMLLFVALVGGFGFAVIELISIGTKPQPETPHD